MGGLLLVGLVAFPLLPVAPLPQVDFPTINVSAQLPGADPRTMASSVAQPLEYQFAEIPGLTQMTSTSVLGSTSIALQFDLDRNIDGAAGDVEQAIAAAAGQLPKNLPAPPTYRKVNPADAPIIDLAVHSDVLPTHHGGRLRRERAGAADLADPGRRAGDASGASRSPPCASRSIRPRSPRLASSSPTSPARSTSQPSMRPRALSTVLSTATRFMTTTS